LALYYLLFGDFLALRWGHGKANAWADSRSMIPQISQEPLLLLFSPFLELIDQKFSLFRPVSWVGQVLLF